MSLREAEALYYKKIFYSRMLAACPEDGATGESRDSAQGRAVLTVTRRFSRVARLFQTRRAFSNAIFS